MAEAKGRSEMPVVSLPIWEQWRAEDATRLKVSSKGWRAHCLILEYVDASRTTRSPIETSRRPTTAG